MEGAGPCFWEKFIGLRLMANMQPCSIFRFSKNQIFPAHLELLVHRLKWLSALARNPSSGGRFFVAWFGEFSFEKRDGKHINPLTFKKMLIPIIYRIL